MGKLKALLLTQGMHGMISQVEGLAKALNTEYNHKIVRLSFPWNLIPPKFTPISEMILKDKIYLTENEIPDLIISCGRKSVIPSIILKKKNLKIFTIHIQNPKVNFKNFDAIVVPEHDNLNGENIYSTKGAIHYITDIEINKAKHYLINKIKGQKIVSLILGGPNKYYSFSKEHLIKIFNKIKSNFISKGYKAIVIPSMRTPKTSIELANREMDGCGYVVNSVDKQAYLSAYALATYVVVTCDSTSMISEAATSGKPIYVAHMKAKKNNYRFKRFFKLFKEIGITRDLGEKVETWTYSKHNEAEREGFTDSMMLDYQGNIAEATGANVFFKNKSGELHTPIPDSFLNGITRRCVIDIAKTKSIEVVERKIKPEEMTDFVGCFLTGTAAEVTPVSQIDKYKFSVCDVIKDLSKSYQALVRKKQQLNISFFSQ